MENKHTINANKRIKRLNNQNLNKEEILNQTFENIKTKYRKDEKYRIVELYRQYRLLTGACKAGCDDFIKKQNIDTESYVTVAEFLDIIEGQYGWDIIKKLKEYYAK